ncbi:hypothetical protein [Mycobacterium nebraskense]|nr:hypothetical protein [Mycobacterium nebraskense]
MALVGAPVGGTAMAVGAPARGTAVALATVGGTAVATAVATVEVP